RKRCALMLPSDVVENLLVVTACVFFLSFSKRYIVGDTANPSVSPGIFFSHLERNAYWPHPNAARPIKLDMPCANILLGFLDGISRIPTGLRGNATARD